jgi:hypothetical protein
MKYIERLGQKKLISHLEVKELEELTKEARKGVSTKEEDLGEPPCSS